SPSSVNGTTVGVSVTNYSADAASGLASNVLSRYIADPVSGSCPSTHASYTLDSSNVTLSGGNDTGLQGNKCYFWRLTGTDNVANTSTSDTSEVKTNVAAAPTLATSAVSGNIYVASGSG